MSKLVYIFQMLLFFSLGGHISFAQFLSGVVLTTEKDIRVFEKSILSALKHLTDVEKFYIITPDAKSLHQKLSEKLGKRVLFIDENQFPFNGSNVTEVMIESVRQKGLYPLTGNSVFEKSLWGRIGWFLQQLLKLYAGKVLGLGDYVILDSDLVWFQNVTFYNSTKNGFRSYNYASSGQHHGSYMATMKRISGFEMFEGKDDVFRSGICHHMVVVKEIMDDLFSTAEKMHGIPFWQALLNQSAIEMTCRAPKQNICGAGSTLSEYELYFTFARHKYPHSVNYRPLLWANGPMPGLLFWPPSDVLVDGKISADKHRNHWLGHRQNEVMHAFEQQILADQFSGYHYVGYHSYAKRRYYELVERKFTSLKHSI
jgi:hypothetical protein